MNTKIEKVSEESIQLAGEVLKQGGIVAFPTDTVYGLGAVCTNDEAVQKIFAAKGRDEGKPLSILVASVEQAEQIALEIPEKARRLMEKYWPGALTLVLKKRPEISDKVSAGRETIGLRMPDSRAAVKLLEAAGIPLAAPSANTSGKRSSVSAEDVIADLAGRVDMILDGGRCPVGISSTVVDLTGESPVILREGSITKTMIDEA
ncbi:MAG: L-threonylcarbamoyladenylate synthase [Lachnospiraceae bacterium]|nr:L-threonylcarbamoyladenylate synthase [Lachnospiraceae bacterium]MDO4733629.1 L-threonylcarbamoyladenylate synthase [Lachnospiraceae bacterium]